MESKIDAMKLIRSLFGHGLKESKELVDSVPCKLNNDPVHAAIAKEMQTKFAAVGAKIDLLPAWYGLLESGGVTWSREIVATQAFHWKRFGVGSDDIQMVPFFTTLVLLSPTWAVSIAETILDKSEFDQLCDQWHRNTYSNESR